MATVSGNVSAFQICHVYTEIKVNCIIICSFVSTEARSEWHTGVFTKLTAAAGAAVALNHTGRQMRRNGFDGHQGHFTLSLPHLLHSHSVPLRNTIPLPFLFSPWPRLPVCRAKRVFVHPRAAFFSAGLCIYPARWQGSRVFSPAGFFVYFLSAVIYILVVQRRNLLHRLKKRICLPAISAFSALPFRTRMPFPCVIVAVLYFSNGTLYVCTRWCILR